MDTAPVQREYQRLADRPPEEDILSVFLAWTTNGTSDPDLQRTTPDAAVVQEPLSEGTFAHLVPRGVGIHLPEDIAASERLYPEEEAVISRAVDKRRRDFTLGRACARAALARMGVPAGPIGVGPNRDPQWPAGIVGTIAHCRGLAVAAVAARSHMAALGIDAEVAGRLTPEVAQRVCTSAEREWISEQARRIAGPWSTVFFGAKESVYKAVSPVTGQWLDFHDVEIDVDPAEGAFGVRFVGKPAPPAFEGSSLQGRFAFGGGLVLAAVMLRAE